MAERQLAAVQGVGDFITPLNYRESESYLPAVIACIDYISSSLATLPVRLCRKDGMHKEVVYDHQIATLLKDPHPQLNGMPELLLLSCTDLLAYGNCIITISNINGRLTLTPIPWGYVTCPYREYDAGYRVTYPDNDTFVFPSSQVVHIRIGCIDGGFIGRSPLARNSATLALAKLVEKSTTGLWQNDCVTTMAFKTNKVLTKPQRDSARQNVLDQTTVAKKGAPIFLDSDLNIQSISANSKDLQHIETRMYQGIVSISMIFGISPVLIGDLRFGTYSNYSQARQAFAHETLSRYQTLFSQALTRKLLVDEDDMKIELDASHLLQDRDAKVKEIVELRKAEVLSPQEAKKELGYG